MLKPFETLVVFLSHPSIKLMQNFATIHYVKSSGWWYTYPSEKYEFVSCDDDIPNIRKVIKFMFQTTNQISIVISDIVI